MMAYVDWLQQNRGKRPWDPGLTEEEVLELWATMHPSEFWVSAVPTEDSYYIVIAPKLYLEERNDMCSCMDLSGILPPCISRSEGYKYVSEVSWMEALALLEKAGFEHSLMPRGRAEVVEGSL